MGLPKTIQIPCHHVLANQNDLKFKKGAPLKQFFNIILGIGIIKKTTFLFVFSTYLLVFYSNFDREISLDVEFNSASNEYPNCILLTDPSTPKIRNTWKNVMMMSSSHFSGIFCFWGRGICQKYTVWVIIECIIKFCIQQALPIEI